MRARVRLAAPARGEESRARVRAAAARDREGRRTAAEFSQLTRFARASQVTFVIMGEGGSVIDTEILRNCNGFGLPPMTKFLDDPLIMDEAEWLV